MIEFIRIVLLLGILGAAVTFVGSAARWWMEDDRRLRRLVRKVLGGKPDGVIVAAGRGAAAGFRLASRQVTVMRKGGADTLLYRLHVLMGAELIVDDQVVARVMRDEPRKVLDQVAGSASNVTLRLMFDDARHPDFSLELWIPRDGLKRDGRPPQAAIREARGWLARAEAIMRRSGPPVPTPGLEPEPEPVAPAETVSAPEPLLDEDLWAPEPEPAPKSAAKRRRKPEPDIPPWEYPPEEVNDEIVEAENEDEDAFPVDPSGQQRLF